MRRIKRHYYYFYYKWYRLVEYTSTELGGAFLTDFKAGIAIIALQIWFVVSFFNYYNIFIDRHINFSKDTYITIGLIMAFLNTLLLSFVRDKWKEYFKEFDSFPKEKQRKGSWIVFGISAFIVLNLIFSFYLMMHIDWDQYK